MRHSRQLLLLLLSWVALTACGGFDKLSMQLSPSRASQTPFTADAPGLTGLYLVDTLSDGTEVITVSPEDGSLQQVWLFDGTTASAYSPTAGPGCPDTQPYTVDSSNQLQVAASAKCPAVSLGVLGEAGSHLTLALPPSATNPNPGIMSLVREASQPGVTEAMFSWNFQAANVPGKLLSLLPVEANADTVAQARTRLRGDFGHLTLTPSAAQAAFLPGLPLSTLQQGAYQVVVFQNGQTLAPAATLAAFTASALGCVLAVPVTKLTALAGYQGQVATIELASALQKSGDWTYNAAAVSETLADNPTRQNHLFVTFADATGITLECSQPRTSGVISLSEVQAALGTLATISAP